MRYLLALIVLFAGCDPPPYSVGKTSGVVTKDPDLKEHCFATIKGVQKFEYNGHTYLRFYAGEGTHSPEQTPVHDPDCLIKDIAKLKGK